MTLVAANIMESRFRENEIIAERYEIINHLGVGSYGNSYLVIDQVSQQKKVLKALRIHKRITKLGKRDFELEKDLLQTINHAGFPRFSKMEFTKIYHFIQWSILKVRISNS